MDFSAILPGAGPGTPRAWSVTLGEQSWAGGHEGGSVGTTMEIWDPGDPPQPFSVWHERWETEEGTYANLRVNSSPESLAAYREGVADPYWLDRPRSQPRAASPAPQGQDAKP